MKYIKIGIVLCVMFALIPALKLEAQNSIKIDVKAIITNPQDEPIVNAAISSEKDNTKTVSDNMGAFSLEVPINTLIKVVADGYDEIYVEATPNLSKIVLLPVIVDNTVQTAFKRTNKDDLYGDVSSVNVTQIMEKKYFTYGLDGMAAYTGGFDYNIWGMDEYLLLIDGVPGEIGTVMPSEIEDISFLKGVQAVALYGSKAAKGVVYVTTKRGQATKQKINVRANLGVFVPKIYPEYLGSSEYMTLYNEASLNDGKRVVYDEEEIDNYASGVNPYLYPDVDYYSSDYIEKSYNRNDVTAEIYGGSEKARYYTNFGYANEGSLLNFGESQNNKTERFNIRGNIDMDINDFISCKVDAAAIFYNARSANTNYWDKVSTLRPFKINPFLPISMLGDSNEVINQIVENSNNVIDGKYLLAGNKTNLTNPIADIYAGGYSKYVSREFKFNTAIDANLDRVIKGLSFHSILGVDYSTSYNLGFNNAYAVYEAIFDTDDLGENVLKELWIYGKDSLSGKQDVYNSFFKQTVAFSGMFNYENTFNSKHHVTGMLVANGFQQAESGIYHRVSNANIGMQVGYNYLNKYYVNFSGAIVHSAKLPDGNRNAFSPTVSLAWRVSDEDFMSGVKAVDNLKLYATAGILNTDLDIDDYYLYKGIYTSGEGTWYSWRDGALVQSYDSRRGSNPALTYPKRKELNLGFETSLFKKLLTMNSSFFMNKMSGNIIMSEVLYPSYFRTYWPNSSFIPYSNYNDDQRMGFDFSANLNKNFGETFFSLGINGTYYDTKATLREENYEYDYQYRQGKPLDGLWGLENDGFFMDEDDIANSPTQSFGAVTPGDIKYKDQNDDGVIDDNDAVYLAKAGWSGSPFTFGVNLTLKWKGLTLFALGTGHYGAYRFKDNDYYWVDGEDKYSAVVRNRWTEETKETATYPRLTSKASNNNFRNSDFWLYSTDRFNLRKVQISYDLPEKLMKKTFFDNLGIYISGSNLLTISEQRDVLDLKIGESPETRNFNIGLKAIF